METNNNMPVLLNQEGLAVLKTASEVLTRNQISVSKAGEVGKLLVDLITTNGMNDNIDEQCNSYMVQINKTIKAMNDRRSPITQLFTQVAKQFTTLESELKDGATVKFIQQQRNDFAAKKAAEKRKAEEEAKRKLAVENEKVEIRKKIEIDLIAFVTNQINGASDHLMGIFNNATLTNFESEIEKIKAFSTAYTQQRYDMYSANISAIYLSKEDVQAIVAEIKGARFQEFAKTYWEQIDDLKINLDGKATSRKSELARLAELERTNKEEAERQKAITAQRQKEEEEKQKLEVAEKQKTAEMAVTANADAEKMNNLFAASEATIVPNDSKAQVRSALKIKVTHQSAWVQIFTHYMQLEGLTLGIEELGKKSLNQMKAACEKHATKTGELIESKYIQYEEDFTAVNKA